MANVPEDVTESLNKITEYLNSSGKDVQTVVDEMKNHFESKSRSANANAVCSSIKKIGNSIDAFKSGDVTKIFSSALDITASMSVIIPEVGPIISVACSLFSAVLGAVGSGGGKSMADVVKDAIEDALMQYEDAELKAEVEGAMRVYSDSLAYLDFDVGTILKEEDVNNLPINVPIYTGINMLGILKSKVNDSAKTNDLTHGKRAIAYTNLYVKLAILRSVILTQMLTLIKKSGHSHNTVNGIKRVTHAEEKRDKEFIIYLTTPTYDKAYLFGQLLPSKEPLLSAFLKKHGLHFQNLKELTMDERTLRPQQWPDWYIKVKRGRSQIRSHGKRIMKIRGDVCGSTTPGHFYFKTVNAKDNIFYILKRDSPSLYFQIHLGRFQCWEEKPKSLGEWKLTQYEDGCYMITRAKCPNWFLYMNWSGGIGDREGDPGPQGHWLIS